MSLANSNIPLNNFFRSPEKGINCFITPPISLRSKQIKAILYFQIVTEFLHPGIID